MQYLVDTPEFPISFGQGPSPTSYSYKTSDFEIEVPFGEIVEGDDSLEDPSLRIGSVLYIKQAILDELLSSNPDLFIPFEPFTNI